VRSETAAGFDGGEAAEDPRRYVNAQRLVALVRAAAKFEKGVLVERPDEAEVVDAA
jgi:hypothetical protein